MLIHEDLVPLPTHRVFTKVTVSFYFCIIHHCTTVNPRRLRHLQEFLEGKSRRSRINCWVIRCVCTSVVLDADSAVQWMLSVCVASGVESSCSSFTTTSYHQTLIFTKLMGLKWCR